MVFRRFGFPIPNGSCESCKVPSSDLILYALNVPESAIYPRAWIFVLRQVIGLEKE